MYHLFSSKLKKNMSKCCIWIHKESFFSFHILAVNAFRIFNAWDFLFTSNFFWFVLPNAKTYITSPGLIKRLYDAWSETKSNFLGTKSLRSIQKLWSAAQDKPYNFRVFLLFSYLEKRTLNLINVLNAPSVTNLARLFLYLEYRLLSCHF